MQEIMTQRDIWNQELVLLEKILLKDGVHKIDGGRLGDFRSKTSYGRGDSLARGTFYGFCQGVVSSKMGRYERGS